MTIKLHSIGTIHSPFTTLENMPIQPAGAVGTKGTVVLLDDYQAGLKDLDGFSHIILVYHFHQSEGYSLRVVPFLDDRARGLFATRAPKRPNPIGLSVVKLCKVKDAILHIENVDVLDGTPLLDIKPYVPQFDAVKSVRTGWLETAKTSAATQRSDHRFGEKRPF